MRASSDLHIKGKLHLGVVIRVVNLEEAMNKFFQVDVAASIQVKDSEEALTNDTWQLSVL